MIRINENYLKLKASYLFADIARRVKAYAEAHPDQPLIRLGIGDVTEPLPAVCVQALQDGADELAQRETFRGYGPEQGYGFLREAIAAGDYADCPIAADEIFVSDGAKCDSANIQEIFAADDLKLAIPDPVYPVYIDTNVMAGRTGENVDDRYQGVTYLECTPENDYVPAIPGHATDLIYLCFPNNPTGAVATREQLQAWVDYAKASQAIIVYDVAYVAFIRDESVPKSIYEIPDADQVAIEMGSFSKTAGFTGTRCAYTVVPKKLQAWDAAGHAHAVHGLWNRRQTTKFNGVSYPVQKAAAAIYTAEGQVQVKARTDGYLENAALVREAVTKLGYACVGGENSPYVWINTGRDSWEFFDLLLNRAGVVCTPGAGFGTCGEGHVRISAFNSRANVVQAMERMTAALT